MKKILALLLAVIMAASFVGCKETDDTKPSGGTTEGTTEDTAEGTTEGTTEDTTEDTTEGTTEEPSEGISRGTIEGAVYKNEFLGFEFTKPSSWVYSTDEEIAALLNIALDSLANDNFKEALENNPAIYDMMVVDSLTRTNINIVYENLAKSFATNITEEQYLEALKYQLSNTEMNVVFSDNIEKVNLGETEFTKCVGETLIQDPTAITGHTKLTQVYYLKKKDGYMASVIVTIASTRDGYTVSDIEAMFK